MSKSHHEAGNTGFDKEIGYGGIRAFGVGLIAVMLFSMAITWWIVVSARNAERSQDPPPSPLAEAIESWEPPGPSLQEFPPTVDLAALRAWEKEHLSQFAHVDEAAGTVRIPIDEAIAILAERGLPRRGEVAAMAQEVFGGVSVGDVSPSGGQRSH